MSYWLDLEFLTGTQLLHFMTFSTSLLKTFYDNNDASYLIPSMFVENQILPKDIFSLCKLLQWRLLFGEFLGLNLKTKYQLLEKFNLLSVNQLAANIKLAEAWKSVNVPNYPIKMDRHNIMGQGSSRVMRPNTTRIWREDAKYQQGKESFCRNTAKLWNNSDIEVKNTETISIAKKAIFKFCKKLPI